MGRAVRVARTGGQSAVGAAAALVLGHLVGWRQDSELMWALTVLCTVAAAALHHLAEYTLGGKHADSKRQ